MNVYVVKSDGSNISTEDAHGQVTIDGEVWICDEEDTVLATYEAGTWASVTTRA